jgi:NDP-sugar pyrophosphorylase family protein
MSGPALIVMAAGIGSRYGGLKQIEPIGPHGEIILDYSVYDAKQAGFQKFIFVINREIEGVFRERIERTIGKSIEVDYVYQELNHLPDNFRVPPEREKPWGTAHAVLSCKHLIDSNFAVINADDFYGRSAFQSLADQLGKIKLHSTRIEFYMVGYKLKNTLTEHGYVSRGICEIDLNGKLISVFERTKIRRMAGTVKYSEDGDSWNEIPEESLASMNMWGFTVKLFNELDSQFVIFLNENRDNLEAAEYFLPEVINQLVEQDLVTVKVLPTDEQWFGVTYQEDLISVKKSLSDMIENGIYPKALWG